MLHSCDAGEYSVITTYPAGFKVSNPSDGWSQPIVDIVKFAMRWYDFTDTMPIHGGRAIEYNSDEFTKPYESPVISGNFMFSYGHLIPNAGY